MIVLGCDPGLRTTGLALVRSEGPGLPTLLARASARAPSGDPDAIATMKRAVVIEVAGFVATFETPQIVGVERFAHRPWLPYRIRDAARMGALVEALGYELRALGLELLAIDPERSKAGWPKEEARRKRIMPAALKNRHERDAFACAAIAAHDWKMTKGAAQ